MTIKEKVSFTLVEGDSYTLTHKGKITHTKGMGRITCEVIFRTLNSDRRVHYNTTGLIICEIKRWIKIYTKDVPPDTEKTTYLPNSKKAKEYIDKWIHWKSKLIPENSAIHEIGFTADFTKQHFVKLNDKLLEPNKLLTYNQALFLLLGLNAIELGKGIKDFPVLDGDKPNEPIEGFFWETLQNQALKSSAFVVNGKITSENLLKLAKDNGFFIEPKTTHKSTTKKDKNVKEVETALLEYLPTLDKKTNKNALVFHRDHDSFSQQFNFRRSTLSTHLTALITLEWWQKQEQKTQDNIKKPKK